MPYGNTQCCLPPGSGENPAYKPQLKQVLDLATPEGCKAELTNVTLKWTGRKLNLRPVNRKSNALPQRQHGANYECGLKGYAENFFLANISIITHADGSRGVGVF